MKKILHVVSMSVYDIFRNNCSLLTDFSHHWSLKNYVKPQALVPKGGNISIIDNTVIIATLQLDFILPGYVPQAILSFQPVSLARTRPGSAFVRTLWTDILKLNLKFDTFKFSNTQPASNRIYDYL